MTSWRRCFDEISLEDPRIRPFNADTYLSYGWKVPDHLRVRAQGYVRGFIFRNSNQKQTKIWNQAIIWMSRLGFDPMQRGPCWFTRVGPGYLIIIFNSHAMANRFARQWLRKYSDHK